MPEYVDPQVESMRESDNSNSISLLLGVSDLQNEIIGSIEETGATVEDTLGQATLRVVASESGLDALCNLDGVKSIEIDRDDVQALTN
jgi:hypothetical protein